MNRRGRWVRRVTLVAIAMVAAATVPAVSVSAATDDGFLYRRRYTSPTIVDCVTSPIRGLSISNGISEFNYPDGAVLRETHSPELGANQQTLSPAASGNGTFSQNYQSNSFNFPQTFVFTIELLVDNVVTYREIVTLDCPSPGPATVTQTEDFLLPPDPAPPSRERHDRERHESERSETPPTAVPVAIAGEPHFTG